MVENEVVSILGADCPLGEEITAVSLRCGYEVQALTSRKLSQASTQNLRVLASGQFEARHIRTVVCGSTCVINLCNLGRRVGASQWPTSETITRNVIESMKHAQGIRYVCLSHQSVRVPGDRLGLYGLRSRYLWPLTHRHRYRDLQNEADLIARSKLQWTLVRCPPIKDVASQGTVSVDRHSPVGRFVALNRLARYLVHLKDSKAYSRDAIFVASQRGLKRYG